MTMTSNTLLPTTSFCADFLATIITAVFYTNLYVGELPSKNSLFIFPACCLSIGRTGRT